MHYLALVQAGLCPDYSGGAWLMKALKDARSRTPVGEVHVKGAGRKLKASGWAMDPVARTPFPAVLTVIEEKDSQLTPISVDLMSQQGIPSISDELEEMRVDRKQASLHTSDWK